MTPATQSLRPENPASDTAKPGKAEGALGIRRSALTAALCRAGKIDPRERDGPREVRIATAGDGAILEARNSHTTVQTPLEAQAQGVLDVVVNLTRLKNTIAAIPARETLTLTSDGLCAEIAVGSARYSVAASEKQRWEATIASGQLRTIVRATHAALAGPIQTAHSHSSTDASRPVYHGVLLISDDEHRQLVATDTFRMITRPLPGASGKFKVILPARELAEAIANGKAGGEVEIAINPKETLARIECAGETWTVTTITDHFGSWQSVLAPVPDALATVTVERELLLATATTAANVSRGQRVVTLAATESSLRVSMIAPQSDDRELFSDTLPAKVAPAAGEASIRFYPEFLVDALRAIDGEHVALTIGAPTRRAQLTGGEVTVMLMPAKAWR
jgi:DNA polymerase III sliding clamp (beta) subunit (PCNA family)